MQGINKSVAWIKDLYVDKEKEDMTLEQMILELKESTNKYREESKIHFENMDKQLAKIRNLVKYTLTEQEKQRIASMNVNELIIEMKSNLDDMRKSLDKIAGDSNE